MLRSLISTRPRIRLSVPRCFYSSTPPTKEVANEADGGESADPSIDESILYSSLPTLSDLPQNPSEPQYTSALIHGRSIHLPYIHPQTHSIPCASLHFRSHNPRLLDLFTHFASHAAASLAIPITRPASLPTQRSLWTVPRSPFAHKKSQENFERKVHKRVIKAFDADPEVVERWTRYLRKHALGGVGLRVTKWERMPVGIGASRLAALDQPVERDADKIKQLGEKIIQQESDALGVAPPSA
ncbi:hypothetical protein ONZ45_g9759 [Pleurotus djamor]|nr:hypothetical protein ONZ45_g9759 [Pleurotus djamor]